MHWHLPLCRIGLQQPQLIRPDMEKATEIALCHEVFPEQPESLTSTHPCQQTDKQNLTNVLVIPT
jgi:hypothetical protein